MRSHFYLLDMTAFRLSPPVFFGLCVICLIRALIWELAEGRPPIFRRDSLVQKSRKPLRCQPMTVSGLTMSKEARHSDQIRDNQTQNRRSFVLITGRFWVRFRMASC